MSRSSNSLRVSDVITTPIKLKYTSSYDCNTAPGVGIAVYKGVNGAVTVTGSVPEETLIYRSIRQLFYSNYLTGSVTTAQLSGSYLTTTSSFDNSLQSSAAFGTEDADIRNFPTGSGDSIIAISIPRNVFGQQISRYGFWASSSLGVIVDDGNGNLLDISALPYVIQQAYVPEFTDWYVYGPVTHVGNVLYKQGFAVITNPNYQNVFPIAPTAIPDFGTYAKSTVPKTINVIANDIAGSGTIVPSSVVLYGSNAPLFTNNLDGTITLNSTTIGTYTVDYTVDSTFNEGCLLTSNRGRVTITVTPDPCICRTYYVQYLGPTAATFTYTACSTGNTETVQLTNDDNQIEVCVCNNEINYDPILFNVSLLSGIGCIADCFLAGSVIVPTTTTTTTTSTTTTTTTAPPTTTTTTTSTTTTTTTAAVTCTYYRLASPFAQTTFQYRDCDKNDLLPITVNSTASPKFVCARTGTVVRLSGFGSATPQGPCPTGTTTTTTSTTTTTTTSGILYYYYNARQFDSENCESYGDQFIVRSTTPITEPFVCTSFGLAQLEGGATGPTYNAERAGVQGSHPCPSQGFVDIVC